MEVNLRSSSLINTTCKRISLFYKRIQKKGRKGGKKRGREGGKKAGGLGRIADCLISECTPHTLGIRKINLFGCEPSL